MKGVHIGQEDKVVRAQLDPVCLPLVRQDIMYPLLAGARHLFANVGLHGVTGVHLRGL